MTSWPNTRSKPCQKARAKPNCGKGLDHAGEWLVIAYPNSHFHANHSCEGKVLRFWRSTPIFLQFFVALHLLSNYPLDFFSPNNRGLLLMWSQSNQPLQATEAQALRPAAPPTMLRPRKANGSTPPNQNGTWKSTEITPLKRKLIFQTSILGSMSVFRVPSWLNFDLPSNLSLQERFMTIFKPRKGMQHWFIAILLLNFWGEFGLDTMGPWGLWRGLPSLLSPFGCFWQPCNISSTLASTRTAFFHPPSWQLGMIWIQPLHFEGFCKDI